MLPSSTLSRRPLTLTAALVAVMVLTLMPAGVAGASSDYEQVVDITFPLAGDNTYIDDYHQPRGDGTRYHKATDIMAPMGAGVHAAVGGTIAFITGLDGVPPSYGYMISIDGDDGRRYNYIHLGHQDSGPEVAYAPGMDRGVRVSRGQLIGYNGCSGNASCSWPHLHFEIVDPAVTDPYGTNRINPYRSLVAAEERGDLPGGLARLAGAVPLVGDWNGDGSDTPGWFYRGQWLLRNEHSEGPPDIELTYGRHGDIPVVGDWNGDGIDTIGVVREDAEGRLRFILRYEYRSGADIVMHYGRRGDTPVTGDWNGNGIDTLGVVRQDADGRLRFILRYEYRSGADIVMHYGRRGDIPVTGDFNGDGTDTLGVVRDRRFILRYVYRSGADIVLDYGRATDSHLIGDWNGDGTDTLGVERDGRWIMRYVYRSGADYVYRY